MSALCTALVITDPVRSYFYLSLSNDEHSFTAVFIHQPPFLMTDSRYYHRFTVFHHQTHFPTTNTHLQPFSSTNLPFQRRTVVFTVWSRDPERDRTELRYTLEVGNAGNGWNEGDGRTKRRTNGRKDGTYSAGVKDSASAYVLCPRLTEQFVSFDLEGDRKLQKGT